MDVILALSVVSNVISIIVGTITIRQAMRRPSSDRLETIARLPYSPQAQTPSDATPIGHDVTGTVLDSVRAYLARRIALGARYGLILGVAMLLVTITGDRLIHRFTSTDRLLYSVVMFMSLVAILAIFIAAGFSPTRSSGSAVSAFVAWLLVALAVPVGAAISLLISGAGDNPVAYVLSGAIVGLAGIVPMTIATVIGKAAYRHSTRILMPVGV